MVPAASPESVKEVTSRPWIAIWAKLPALPVRRSTLKPVLLVEVSVHARVTVLDERATARRPDGGTGGARQVPAKSWPAMLFPATFTDRLV